MARSEKEGRLLREAERLLESEDVKSLQNIVFRLICTYQRLNGRLDKILHQSDRQQEQLLKLNEKLLATKEEQEKSIENLIDEKRARAKTFIESKTKLFEWHQREISSYKDSQDKLTTILIEKEELQKNYNLLLKEYEALKSSTKLNRNVAKEQEYSEFEYQSAILAMTKDELYTSLRNTLKNITDLYILNGQINAGNFGKTFFKTLKRELLVEIGQKNKTEINNDQLCNYIIRTFLNDIVSILADMIFIALADKNKYAMNFVSFFDGETTLNENSEKIKKPDIIDKSGNRWMTTAIFQVAYQKVQSSKALETKKRELALIKNNINKLEGEQVTLKLEIENDKFKSEKLKLNSVENKDEIKCLKENIQNNETYLNSKNEELEKLKTLFKTDSTKYLLIQEKIKPEEERYAQIVEAFSRALISFSISR